MQLAKWEGTVPAIIRTSTISNNDLFSIMDPFSLFVGIGTLFQETYLLVNYVYKTVSSAKESDEEREDIAASMRWELLMLESFGRWFTRADGDLTEDSMLDEVGYLSTDRPAFLSFQADICNRVALATRNTICTEEIKKRF